MTIRTPIVIVDHKAQPLPDGDSVSGLSGISELHTDVFILTATDLSNKYVLLTYETVSREASILFVYRSGGSSPKQRYGIDYTVVQTAVNNGDYRRLTFSSSAIPPDLDDAVPTTGMQDSLYLGDEIEVVYARPV